MPFTSANEIDPFSAYLAEACKPPKPKRGYIESVPFFKTDNELITIHAATIESPVTPYIDLPLIQVDRDSELPYAKAGDEIYNITSWFPLHEMSQSSKNEEKRWVYYNKTNGYIIAYADQFLMSSIYDYVTEIHKRNSKSIRLSITSVRVRDNMSLNIRTISESPHTVLWKSSSTSWHAEKTYHKIANKRLITESLLGESMTSVSCKLELSINAEEVSKSQLHIPVNQWIVCEWGISENGEKDVIMIKAEVVNLHGDALDLTVTKNEFMTQNKQTMDDPFGVGKSFYIDHQIPPGLNLSKLHDSKVSPFADPHDDLKKESHTIDASKFLEPHGVHTLAKYNKKYSILSVYGSAYEHEIVSQLFNGIQGGRQLALIPQFSFYEVDAISTSKPQNWTIENVLSGNPLKLASFGAISNGAKTVNLSKGKSKCHFYVMKDDSMHTINFSTEIDLQFSNLKVQGKHEGTLEAEKPSVIFLKKRPKSNRVVVMIINVKMIDNKWY